MSMPKIDMDIAMNKLSKNFIMVFIFSFLFVWLATPVYAYENWLLGYMSLIKPIQSFTTNRTCIVLMDIGFQKHAQLPYFDYGFYVNDSKDILPPTAENMIQTATGGPHGMEMVSIISHPTEGVYSNVKIIPVKVNFNDDTLSGGIKELHRRHQNGEYRNLCDRYVFSVSGSGWWNDPGEPRATSDVLSELSYFKDAILISCAGNRGTNLDNIPDTMVLTSPDRFESIIRVAATEPGGTLWKKSCYGTKNIDIAFPGAFIKIPGLSDSEYKEGTSISTAAVAGIVAWLWDAYPTLTRTQIRNMVILAGLKDAPAELPVMSGRVFYPNLFVKGAFVNQATSVPYPITKTSNSDYPFNKSDVEANLGNEDLKKNELEKLGCQISNYSNLTNSSLYSSLMPETILFLLIPLSTIFISSLFPSTKRTL